MASAEPPSKRRKLNLSESYSVVVGSGPYNKTFVVQKCFLTKSSEFFKAACNKEWKEGQTKTIELLGEKPACFETYLQWLYTNELVVTEEAAPSQQATRQDRLTYGSEVYPYLIDLYCLADMLHDVPCGNAIQDQLVSMLRTTGYAPTSNTVKSAYERSAQGSVLRRLLVDMYIEKGNRAYFEKSGDGIFHEFLVDIAASMAGLLRSGGVVAPWDAPKCTYHEHNDTYPPCE